MWLALFLLVIPVFMILITRYVSYPASIALVLAAFLIRKPMVSYAESNGITTDIIEILGVILLIAWLTAHHVLAKKREGSTEER